MGIGEMSVQSMGGWGNASAQNLSKFFLKILTKGAASTEAGGLAHTLISQPSLKRPTIYPMTVIRTLEYLVGIPSKDASCLDPHPVDP